MARGTTAACAALIALFATVAPAQASTTAFVHGQDFSWVPQQVTILPGDSVDWGNDDDVTHSVTELSCPRAGGDGPCSFNTDVAPGQHFSYTFATPGLYEYQCAIHIFFGSVKVLGDGSALPDLRVATLSAVQASSTAPLTLRLTAIISNVSSVAGAGRSDVVFQYRRAGGDWRPIGTSLSNAVPANGSTTVRILWDATGRIGDFEIRAIADGLTQVAESDETNNERATGASVLVAPGTVSPGIDLTEEP